jgi:hypothetical protein
MAAMDETTFQKELRELKHCVTDIANSPSPALSAVQLSNYMSANAVHNDMFVAQLRDVRTRLDIMQGSLLQHGRDQATEAPRQRQFEIDHDYMTLSYAVTATPTTGSIGWSRPFLTWMVR